LSKSAKKAAAPKPAPAAPKDTPTAKKTPTAKDTPALYLAKHEKPLPASERTIKEIAKARAKTDASKKAKPQPANDTGKPSEPEGGRSVIIAGEGTMPLGADNWRRVPRGTSISVSEAELAWLEANGVAFKRA
jgi:hypothetical protein